MTDAAPEVELRGKTALVTGAGTRVGRAIAIALGAQGMRVGVHFRSSAIAAERTARDVEAAGGSAVLLPSDLATRAGARSLADAALTALGGLDLLVPSAAGFEKIPLAGVDDDAWDRMMELNLASPFALTQRLVPALRASLGSIVFIGCASHRTPFRGYLPYVVSKAGLTQLARVLCLELAPDVRVNVVAPGTVLPPPSMSAGDLERVRERIPLRRLGSPEDIARTVVYLACSPFVTGQEIVVDGGRTVAGFERFG